MVNNTFHALNRLKFQIHTYKYNHNFKALEMFQLYSNMVQTYIILRYRLQYPKIYRTLSYLQFYQQTKSKIVNSQFKAQTL